MTMEVGRNWIRYPAMLMQPANVFMRYMKPVYWNLLIAPLFGE